MNTETPDVNTVVESSTSTQAPSNEADISTLSSEQHHHWRMTGEMPAQEGQPKADSAPASEADKTAKSAAASEAATPQKPNQKRDNAETRLQEILADLKQAGLSPAELKTFKREAAAAQPKAESKPAPQPEVKAAPVQKLEEPKEPDIADPKYAGDNGWTLYEADVKKYNKDFATYQAAKAVEDYKRQQIEAQQTEKLTKELTAAREIYKDYDEKVAPVWKLFADTTKVHPAVSEAAGRSPVNVHLMYVIGGDKATTDRLLALSDPANPNADPIRAIMELGVIEKLVMEELDKTSNKDTTRNDKGQFQASGNKVSKAPAPPSQVDGKGNPPADETEAALSSGDTRAYIDSENKKDLARFKANRR